MRWLCIVNNLALAHVMLYVACCIGMYMCILYACAVLMFGARSVGIVKQVAVVFTVYNIGDEDGYLREEVH